LLTHITGAHPFVCIFPSFHHLVLADICSFSAVLSFGWVLPDPPGLGSMQVLARTVFSFVANLSPWFSETDKWFFLCRRANLQFIRYPLHPIYVLEYGSSHGAGSFVFFPFPRLGILLSCCPLIWERDYSGFIRSTSAFPETPFSWTNSCSRCPNLLIGLAVFSGKWPPPSGL